MGMHEAMWAYTKRTGLTPIGPHRRLSDELFGDQFEKCDTCDGRGVLDVENGQSWCECPDCHFLGTFFKGTKEEFIKIRSRIIAQYPRAASPSFVPEEWLAIQNPRLERLESEAKLRRIEKGIAPKAELRCVNFALVVRNQALKTKWPGGPADYWSTFKTTFHNLDLSATCFREKSFHSQYRELIGHGFSESNDLVLINAARIAASMRDFDAVAFDHYWLGGFIHKGGIMIFLRH